MGEGESENLQGSKMVTNIHHLFINKLYHTSQGYVFYLITEWTEIASVFRAATENFTRRNSLPGPKDCNTDWRSDDQPSKMATMAQPGQGDVVLFLRFNGKQLSKRG